MVRTSEIRECFKNLIGWKQHYNSEIVINPDLMITESGEFYQDFHPALSLNLIKQSLERGRDLNEYLATKTDTAITQLLNDVDSKRKEQDVKDLLVNETVLNKYGWANDKIYNENRFVGFMFELTNSFGLNLIIQSIGMQLSLVQELDIYVYHSSQLEPIEVKTLNIDKPISWNWLTESISLYKNNDQVQGGMYYIGYYQSDLIGNAINYTDFNWNKGYCGTCDGGTMHRVWNKIKKYVYFMPFFVPEENIGDNRTMFDAKAVQVDNSKSWGMNFKIAVGCELTNFFCDNRMALKNALGLKVAYLILQDIKFSQEFNGINEDLKALIINDLEGDKDTFNYGIAAKLSKEIKNVVMNTSGLGRDCLPCQDYNAPTTGAA